jgi:hypothetical protein
MKSAFNTDVKCSAGHLSRRYPTLLKQISHIATGGEDTVTNSVSRERF